MAVVVPGVKMSQFLEGGAQRNTDYEIGLRGDVNTKFSNVGFFFQVTQAAHGFIYANILAFTGVNYVKAQANSIVNSNRVVGLVSRVVDADNFIVQIGGTLTSAGGVVPGTLYYLSPTVAGNVDTVAPVVPGQVVKPMYVGISATTTLWLNQLGVLI